MKKDKKVLELVPIDKKIENEFNKIAIKFLEDTKEQLLNGEISELIIITKFDDSTEIIPITYSLTSAVGMLELSKQELIISRFMDEMIED
uniref:Uncharacterized protein n=1 Tax=viral metagenome TaxID=1070528 RepID=A0A6C0JW31_9ZZZZ